MLYSAFDEKHNRQVAIKVLIASHLDENTKNGLVRELHAMGPLSEHSNIASVYQSGTTQDGESNLFW